MSDCVCVCIILMCKGSNTISTEYTDTAGVSSLCHAFLCYDNIYKYADYKLKSLGGLAAISKPYCTVFISLNCFQQDICVVLNTKAMRQQI